MANPFQQIIQNIVQAGTGQQSKKDDKWFQKNLQSIKSESTLMNPSYKPSNPTVQMVQKFIDKQRLPGEMRIDMQKRILLENSKKQLQTYLVSQETAASKKWQDQSLQERIDTLGVEGAKSSIAASAAPNVYQGMVGLLTPQADKQKWVKNKILKTESLGYLTGFDISYSDLRNEYPDLVKKKEEEYDNLLRRESDKPLIKYIKNQTGLTYVPNEVFRSIDINMMKPLIEKFYKERRYLPVYSDPVGQLVRSEAAARTQIEKENWERMDPFEKAVYKTSKTAHKYADPLIEGVLSGLTFTDIRLEGDFERAVRMEMEGPENFGQKALRMSGYIAGGFVPYGLISKGVKVGISGLAGMNAMKYMPGLSRSLGYVDELAKTNNIWKSVLAEATIFNVLEENVDAVIRKGILKQDYTFNDFMMGITMGAGFGSTIQIGGHILKGPELQKQMQVAVEEFQKTGDFESVRSLPLGDSTFGSVFQETRFAYYKGLNDPNARPGIERPAPLPETLAIPKELEPLAAEARKYKSAEEFVGARGETLYHGTSKEFDTFIPSEEGRLGKGIYLIDSISQAGVFGKNIKEVKVNLKKPFIVKENSPSIWKQTNIKSQSGSELQAFLKKRGYDGIIEELPSGAKEYVVFDANQVKTKSQLTDIWNQANQKLSDTILKTDRRVGLGGERQLTPEDLVTRGQKVSEPTELKMTLKESRVYERLKNEIPENIREEVGYTPINLKDDVRKALKFLEKDKSKAYQVAMGMEDAPKGQTSTAVNIALAEKALQEGNNVLYSQLVKNRSLDQTRRGQEIVAEKGSVTDNSTARYVKELINTRMEQLGDKYTLGIEKLKKVSGKEKVIHRIDSEVKKAKTEIAKSKLLDIAEAQKIIDNLICK